jgi:hypothetical protein
MGTTRQQKVDETKGLIVYPLPEEEFEYLCSLHGPYLVMVIAELLEWTKVLDKEGLFGATTDDIRERIDLLLDEYYLRDIVRRLEIKEEIDED